ncbi:MAG: alpha/beta hydrolase fold domain-containing protein, partial [Granulosicoccus sp.]
MHTDTPKPDYSVLIDQQTQAFIDRTNAAYPDNAVSLSIDAQRQLYDAMCQEFQSTHPPGMQTRDYSISSNQDKTDRDRRAVPVRQYTPASSAPPQDNTATPHIIYLHGGGFIVGGLESHDDVCAEISDRTGHTLTSVDYCLAPEHKHPAALEEVMLVMSHLWQASQQPLLLCGDSAGATLAAAACHAFRRSQADSFNKVQIIAQVLVYPGLGGATSKGSYIRHANSPMLTTDEIRFYSEIRCACKDDMNCPTFAPLCDTDFSCLPPTVVFSAECDPLNDDGQQYCDFLQQAGGSAHWINEQGLVH